MISHILCHPRWYHSGCGFAKVHPEHKLIMRFPQFLQVLGPQPNLFQRLWIGCKAERWPGPIPRARTFWDMSTMTFSLFSPTRMKRLTEQNHANINHHCERVRHQESSATCFDSRLQASHNGPSNCADSNPTHPLEPFQMLPGNVHQSCFEARHRLWQMEVALDLRRFGKQVKPAVSTGHHSGAFQETKVRRADTC